MSDSEDSTVMYMQVSSPFVDLSDIGSPGVDGPPMIPEDPYAYIVAAYQAPPSPDYIPGPEEPQSPLPLDFEEPEEDDEDPEEDPADYPADRDDDDEEEEEPSGDDVDDEDEDEDDDEEEEEEHPAPADSVPPVHRMTAKISIWDEPSISLPPREEVDRLLALTTPPPSPLTPLSSPLPQIPSPPLPASPPASLIRPLGYRAAMIRLRAETPSTSHPLPLPTSSPPLYEIGESSAATAARPIGGRRADYGFVDLREAVEEVALMTLEGDRKNQIYQSIKTLVDDSKYHYKTVRLLDQEALVSREAWGRSMEVSYMARSEIMTLRSVVISQQAVISLLQAADSRSQTVTSEMLQADHRRQTEIAALRTADRTR
ncbi:hypothetical protein Tco_0324084 [Tanacetum coccineum]